MTTPDPFELALVHFQPPLPPERRGPVLEALRAIAEDYRRNATNKVRYTAPMEKVGETPEEYILRLQALSATPRGKGKPKGLSAALMVHTLRRLVIQEGRDHSVSLNYDGPSQTFLSDCPLASMAEAIDDLVGNPNGRKAHSAWRNIAAEVSRPLWELETLCGLDGDTPPLDGPGLLVIDPDTGESRLFKWTPLSTPGARKAINDDLKDREGRPSKRKKA